MDDRFLILAIMDDRKKTRRAVMNGRCFIFAIMDNRKNDLSSIRSPSRDCSQWHKDRIKLAYRCGGSVGFQPTSRFTLASQIQSFRTLHSSPVRAPATPRSLGGADVSAQVQTRVSRFRWSSTRREFRRLRQRAWQSRSGGNTPRSLQCIAAIQPMYRHSSRTTRRNRGSE